MTLLVAGFWPTTFWAENYWQQDYWPEYGYVAPTGGDSAHYYYMLHPPEQWDLKPLLESIRTLLISLKEE